LIALVMHH